MKIALVAPSSVPFTVGGAEKLWWGLLHHLNQLTDHQVELIKLPSPERSLGELLSSYRRFSELDLSHFDCVISTKYPAWMVSHPNHRLYLQHPLRGLYDTYPWPELASHDPFSAAAWPTPAGRQAMGRWRRHPQLRRLQKLLAAAPERAQLPELFATLEALQQSRWLPAASRDALLAFPGPLTRAVIHHLDAIAMAPGAIRRYAAISQTVTRRAHYFPRGEVVKVIHHPSDLPPVEPAPAAATPPYLFTVSRLDGPKRIELLVRAFMASRADLELRIAGTGPEEEALRQLAAGDPRIRFLGFLRDSQVAEQYRHALAVPFLPYQEDYGLITIEAMSAGKPVITCNDAGGVTEFVRHGENGWCVPPEPAALAEVIEALGRAPESALAMADAARRSVAHVNWPSTVAALLEAPAADARPQCPAQVTGLGAGEHWLVLNTYSVYPPMGGGQNRMFHLYRHLAAEPGRRVTLLVLAPVGSEECRREIAPGLVEHRVPLSEAQQQRLEALEKALGVPVEDIAAIEGWRLNTRFVERLKHYASEATMGVAAHPYLAGALHEHLDVPWGYESHNVEALLKRDILAQALRQNLPEARAALRQVEEIERLACCAGAWVSACTEADLASFTSHYGLDPRRGIVVPNGADIQRLPFVDMALRRRWQASLGQQRPTALFIGSWHGPNLEAARLIMERLAPACPAVDFLVVGSLCLHPDLADIDLPPNLRLMGTVTDAELGALLASVDVALNPMGSGSGSNLKMLDYTASGVPVLTTPFGNRGFDFDERHLWLAELDRLAAALERLLATPRPAQEARVARARRLTQDAYAWHRIAPRLGEAARIHRLHSSEGGASMQACSRTLFSDA